jgi:glycosyltransferase involved in cell wall biosynthesis
MAIAEAGAAGLPIVSTRLAGIPELVMEGLNGFLFKPVDINGLTLALECLIENEPLRREMSAQSKKIVAKDHDAKKNARQLLDIVRDVINEPKRKPLKNE